MKRMLSAITCGAWLVGCVALGEGVAAEAETGATLYKKHKCARCHGDEGKGDGPVFARKGKSIGDWTQPATLAEFDDAYLAETGIRGKLFASRSAASVASISKLIEYDARILEEVERATRAMAELEKAIAAGEENVKGGAIRLRSAFTTAHARFRERVKYIRGFGD